MEPSFTLSPVGTAVAPVIGGNDARVPHPALPDSLGGTVLVPGWFHR
jgi:hypothetical protein